MNTTYKIFRKRQNKDWWVDITNVYSLTNELYNESDAFDYTKEYKSKHRSDSVKITKIVSEDIIIG